MSTKVIVRIIIGAIILILLGIIYVYQSGMLETHNNEQTELPPIVQNDQPEEKTENASSTPTEVTNIATDRLKDMEDSIADLEDTVSDHKKLIDDLSDNTATSASPSSISGKAIFATASTEGSVYSSTATAYASMNFFVNIVCPKECVLWIDFSTISKNDTANNVNTYGIFLNGGDQAISSYATMSIANGAVPISLSGAIPTSAGTHTVEIRAKTSGGTLQTDTSFLKVLAIESL